MISTIFIPITDVSETLVFIQHCTRKFKTTNFFAVPSKLEPKPREDGTKNANLKNYEFRSLLVTP